ncbi:MAG: NAD(P)-dependent oxidoreductase [Phycisphaerales bacterium]|nr:NAD(P)-dependent oxidoreductase [Phycisphaerales bacterium]
MTNPLVLITEPIAQEPKAWLSERCTIVEMGTDHPEFHSTLARAEGLVVRTYTIVDQSMLDQAPKLKVIARAGVGLDNIDIDACTSRGIRVVNAPHANAMAVVEYMISMLLTTLRPIHRITNPSDLNNWHQLREDAITPRSIIGTTLGIIGLGYIGSRVARAATGLGMEVHHNDLRTIPETQRQGSTPQSLETLLSKCETISIHVDGRAQNKDLINDDAFALMRPDVVFINASRGFVVDHHAAARFASANPDATLIFDVHHPEPIHTDSPLLGLPNVILTPHIAAATKQAKTEMSWVVRDVVAVLSGQDPAFPAN